jgi:hypothetical protein
MPVSQLLERLRSGRLQFKPAQANHSQDPISKNNKSKMDWRCDASSKVPILQAQSPEFKPQSHQKNKISKHMQNYFSSHVCSPFQFLYEHCPIVRELI